MFPVIINSFNNIISSGEMNMEIERKWLIKTEKVPFDLDSCEKVHIEQAYVSFSPTIRIRNVDRGRVFLLTVKTKAHGFDPELAKNEYETQITKEEYHQLMQIVRGNVISKTRYVRRVNDGLIYEIDVFEGEFSGLAYLEIEFQDSATAASYPDPEWVERDVTYFPEFKNSALAKYGMPPMR
jgi:CYTH domain-containing protein